MPPAITLVELKDRSERPCCELHRGRARNHEIQSHHACEGGREGADGNPTIPIQKLLQKLLLGQTQQPGTPALARQGRNGSPPHPTIGRHPPAVLKFQELGRKQSGAFQNPTGQARDGENRSQGWEDPRRDCERCGRARRREIGERY